MNIRLLGGWEHVADDAVRLDRRLREVPDGCHCGHGSAHLRGTCQCCRTGERRLDDPCSDCESLLASVGDQIADLVDATLRFLPFIELASRAPFEVDLDVSAVRRDVMRVSRTFLELETAAGEFRNGCAASHLSAVKGLARKLAEDVARVDDLLRASANQTVRGAARLGGSHGSAA